MFEHMKEIVKTLKQMDGEDWGFVFIFAVIILALFLS